jgi:hypothetical protein
MLNQGDKESASSLYFVLIMFLVVGRGFVLATITWIHRGEIVEISGPGGHVIGKVSATNDPFEFWGEIVGIYLFIGLSIAETVRQIFKRRT